MIKFQNISKYYGKTAVLHDITFCVNQGEFFVIVGLSGSGKTTLLKMINNLVSADSGKITINSKDINEWDLRDLRLETGYVLQQDALFPNLSIYENIALIPKMKKWDQEKIRGEIHRLMPIVGLDPNLHLNKYPEQLSGGERQRVGILRAIITKPKVLLMDEPFSALDPLIKRDLQILIKKLHTNLGITIFFVTHDMRESVLLADRIVVLQSGKLLQVDTPKNIISHPKDNFVKKLFESADLI